MLLSLNLARFSQRKGLKNNCREMCFPPISIHVHFVYLIQEILTEPNVTTWHTRALINVHFLHVLPLMVTFTEWVVILQNKINLWFSHWYIHIPCLLCCLYVITQPTISHPINIHIHSYWHVMLKLLKYVLYQFISYKPWLRSILLLCCQKIQSCRV